MAGLKRKLGMLLLVALSTVFAILFVNVSNNSKARRVSATYSTIETLNGEIYV